VFEQWCKLVLALLLFTPVGQPANGNTDVSVLKVAYLYYFSKFISWPSGSIEENHHLNLCVGDVTEKTRSQLSSIMDSRVGLNTLKVVYLDNLVDHKFPAKGALLTAKQAIGNLNLIKSMTKQCHIVFVDEGMSGWFEQHARFFPEYALVVAESLELNNAVIYLYSHNKHLLFEIDNTLALEKNIVISSKLLSLSQERGER